MILSLLYYTCIAIIYLYVLLDSTQTALLNDGEIYFEPIVISGMAEGGFGGRFVAMPHVRISHAIHNYFAC